MANLLHAEPLKQAHSAHVTSNQKTCLDETINQFQLLSILVKFERHNMRLPTASRHKALRCNSAHQRVFSRR